MTRSTIAVVGFVGAFGMLKAGLKPHAARVATAALGLSYNTPRMARAYMTSEMLEPFVAV